MAFKDKHLEVQIEFTLFQGSKPWFVHRLKVFGTPVAINIIQS
jgi:hypothetical protein